MKYEQVFTVREGHASPLTRISLAEAGFLERQDLERWLIQNPSILGDDVLIVTSEFDRWSNSAGDPKKDRLDVLGIDGGGRLVVVELKRDLASSDVDLQALKYAALVSRFTTDTLVDAYRRFHEKLHDQSISTEQARARLESHVEEPLDPEVWAQPRVVLIANNFPETVTNTVVWLSEAGIDIRLIRYQLYTTSGDPLLVAAQLYPVPDTEDFLLRPRREEVQLAKEQASARQRQRDAVSILVDHSAIPSGAALHVEPTGINEDLRAQVLEWLAEVPSRSEGVWHADPAEPIEWSYTGTRGKPSQLAGEILYRATGTQRALRGTQWWVLDDGLSLAAVAESFAPGPTRSWDWSDLHAILEQLPEDAWTTYGDLANAIGTAAMPVGAHLAACGECVNAVQVLNASGRVAAGFRWGDPEDDRVPEEVLQAKGVRFLGTGVADPSQRLGPADLRRLVAEYEGSSEFRSE